MTIFNFVLAVGMTAYALHSMDASGLVSAAICSASFGFCLGMDAARKIYER